MRKMVAVCLVSIGPLLAMRNLGAIANSPVTGSRSGQQRSVESRVSITPKEIHACYVPGSGQIYRIKADGVPDGCRGNHMEFSWNSENSSTSSSDWERFDIPIEPGQVDKIVSCPPGKKVMQAMTYQILQSGVLNTSVVPLMPDLESVRVNTHQNPVIVVLGCMTL